MGSRLALAADKFVVPYLGGHHRTALALNRMALTALDDDENPVYFAGIFPLARTLRYTQAMSKSDLPGDEDEQEALTEVLRRKVAKAIKPLLDMEIITVKSKPEPGRNVTVYALHVEDYPKVALFRMPPRHGVVVPLPFTPPDPVEAAAVDEALRPPGPLTSTAADLACFMDELEPHPTDADEAGAWFPADALDAATVEPPTPQRPPLKDRLAQIVADGGRAPDDLDALAVTGGGNGAA